MTEPIKPFRSLSFFVLGDPKAQPRVKASRRGGFVRMWTPDTADAWKAAVRRSAFLALEKQADKSQFTGPLSVALVFHMPRPKSHYGKKVLKAVAPHWHAAKPDVDNLCKSTFDALEDLGLFKNDSQVCSLAADKVWASSPAGCHVAIQELST